MSVKVVLLCEDLQTATFIRRFLLLGTHKQHEIRVEFAPPGKGSGEQWVRDRYPNELLARRKKNTVLIVGTDADQLSVVDRIATLDRQCMNENVPVRSTTEPVIIAVPKRNIETWFVYLRGENPNEDDTYPKYSYESQCRDDVKVLDEMCRKQQLRQPVPPSLQAACVEFGRMLK